VGAVVVQLASTAALAPTAAARKNVRRESLR